VALAGVLLGIMAPDGLSKYFSNFKQKKEREDFRLLAEVKEPRVESPPTECVP
jgi:hypothetical protein